MKAVFLDQPGQFRVSEVDPPAPPGPGEALVATRRVGVCGTDLHAYEGKQPFFNYPRILGHELCVEVLEAGENDFEIAAGDRCSVEPYLHCGHCKSCRRGLTNCCVNLKVLGVSADGGMRERFVLPLRKLHPSKSLSFDQLALVEMLSIGAHAVERASLSQNDDVLILGVGPIGLAVLEFVRLAGLEVSVLDVNEARLDYCRRTLNIRNCIDARQEPLAALRELKHGELPTVVFDCTGNPKSMLGALDYMAHGGKLVFVGLFPGEIKFNDPAFHLRETTLLSSRNATAVNFRRAIRLLEAGVIDAERWITHRVAYSEVAEHYPVWLAQSSDFRKAIVEW
ncbi:MAG TPA: zinc-binding alcohol dehydrogenase family protein [Terriglobia bacterium]|nr:zinc-binding alcohol dehydrogenase family protein [Terriglobia bacterium]